MRIDSHRDDRRRVTEPLAHGVADRFLGEAHASGGDPLQLINLFEISDPTAI